MEQKLSKNLQALSEEVCRELFNCADCENCNPIACLNSVAVVVQLEEVHLDEYKDDINEQIIKIAKRHGYLTETREDEDGKYMRIWMEFKAGDAVWASNYEVNGVKQEPVFGTLLPYEFEPESIRPFYFKPDGEEMLIPVESLHNIARTKEECQSLYNIQIVTAIGECQEKIEQMNADLIPMLDGKKKPDSWMEVEPVWRADLSCNYAAVCNVMNNNLIPKDDCGGTRFPWDEFINDVEDNALSDYDGFGDLLIDNVASENVVVCIGERTIFIGDCYRVPFERVPEVFDGHTIEIMWFNN